MNNLYESVCSHQKDGNDLKQKKIRSMRIDVKGYIMAHVQT